MRLSNILEVELVSKPILLDEFPSTKRLAIELEQHTISIREFLGLRQCKLHLVIAQRNSQMGKVASPSQRLKNDLDILASGPICLTKINNTELRNKLSNYLSIKQKQIPKTLWHALLGQAEYKKFWSQKQHSPTYPQTISSQTVTEDLELLNKFANKVLSKQYNISTEEFNNVERTLGRLRFGDAGQLLSELTALHVFLAQANNAIEQRLLRKLCLTPKPNEKARYFENVVRKYFIQNVQAQAVSLRRRYDQLAQAINDLEEQLAPHSTPEFQHWRSARNNHIQLGLNSVLLHSRTIQEMFMQCGITPERQN